MAYNLPRMTAIKALFLLVIAMSFVASAPSSADTLGRNNDRWVCLGDSITAMNCYPKVLAAVFKHYHPGATLTVVNSGVGGDTASDDPKKLQDRVLKYDPSIVSIMYGMNEAINTWQPGQPKQPVQEHYRQCLTYMARTLRQKGVTVLLMSPTLTDPTCHSYFTLEKTVPFLHECAAIMHDVAAREGAFYIPVQEEFEAYQESLPAGVALRADGVHPSALGQYRIARSLWEHAGFALPLNDGKRKLATAPSPVPVCLSLDSRFAATSASAINLTMNAPRPLTIDATWSAGTVNKVQSIMLAAGANKWSIPVSPNLLPARNGQAGQILLDLKSGTNDTLYVIDFCRTAVWHLAGDTTTDTIKSDDDESQIATWKVTRAGDDLQFDFDVLNDKIEPDGVWPFSRDGLNLMLDLRPTSRFADIGVDREVYQAFVTVRDKPFFAPTLRMWTGLGLDFAASVGGEKTATGYSAHVLLHDSLNLHTPFNLKSRDFIGFLPAVDEHLKNSAIRITSSQKNDEPVNIYANNLPILDLKNAIPGDSIVNIALYEAR